MHATILGGIWLVIAVVHSQDFAQNYLHPTARHLNLRRLANRIDKFIQVPKGFWDGSFLRDKPSSSMREDNYDTASEIGLRSNFEDLPKPSNDIAPRRLPMQIMEETGMESGSPLPPTQWQLMVAPFITLMPDITEYCQCKAMANCGCCLGFYIKPIGVRNNLCLNVTLTKDSLTQSQYMIHTKVHFDQFKLIDFSFSEKQSPIVCVSVFPFSSLAGCVQIVDMHRDVVEDKMCQCLAASLQFSNRPVISLPPGCLCEGHPVPQSKKRGPFGLDIGMLLHSMQDMLFG